jgi:hypothetical protein
MYRVSLDDPHPLQQYAAQTAAHTAAAILVPLFLDLFFMEASSPRLIQRLETGREQAAAKSLAHGVSS